MDGLLKMIFSIDQTTAVLIATLCVVMLIYIFFEKGNIRYQLPAGPVKWPFMGNIPHIMLAGSMPRFCQKYSKIYGNVSFLSDHKFIFMFPFQRDFQEIL